jgi:hydroxyethylthiazole kinase-like uncharacterized protein yjeF
MKNIFKEVSSLDQNCYEKYSLSEDLLMEHAAIGLKNAIPSHLKSVFIVSGPGNNGADGIALSRMLHNEKEVFLYLPFGVKSKMAQLQLQRAKSIGVNIVEDIVESDIVVDCLFGSGLSRELDANVVALIEKLNNLNSYKIACDIPSGIDIDGNIKNIAFTADITVTMGALKYALYADNAKDYVSKIRCVDLGVSSENYENESSIKLLEISDMKLPHREQKNCHKGDFGHLSVIAGKKPGAAIIAAKAAYAFGVGLVTVVENEPYDIPHELMSSTTLPHSNSAICIGMGLGNQYDKAYLSKFLLQHNLPLLIDADLFYSDMVIEALNSDNPLVLTPHPKEFSSLLKISLNKEITTKEIQSNRLGLVLEFTSKFKNVVLVLKGSNTLIAQNEMVYIQSFGTNALSKGGSGDVLGGLIASLLAQGYDPLDAAITGSIAHALSAKKFDKNSYALTPQDLIEGVKCL